MDAKDMKVLVIGGPVLLLPSHSPLPQLIIFYIVKSASTCRQIENGFEI
jgi:hypothetical protein